MKTVDFIASYGVMSGHLLNTGMYGTAPDSIAVFLRPAFKGVLGWAGNILNTCRSLTYAVFNIPALVLNSFEQEYVMKTSKKNLIRTLAYDAARDLALLRDIFLQTPIAKSNPNSIAALFTGVECRLASINFQIIKGESS